MIINVTVKPGPIFVIAASHMEIGISNQDSYNVGMGPFAIQEQEMRKTHTTPSFDLYSNELDTRTFDLIFQRRRSFYVIIHLDG